ncbi:adenosylhomocysteine nucleosidase [Bathymodiolus japonicus methanotrophic gill symbiont]|uniref:phosphorylase family protein n=1 Tax=Bathymodiolus japonicus methanotrophic gill symbiont TaxID=113269 RepID=UPI001B3CA91E|nr:phosphorylase [Bathymodiolus japonicus methanotrophic gill symbiont]GFO72648.1 adenosylhomocysteine nucleosidase [Bathymodiolus japonicus methanotrophic gill symbiont]
MITGILVALPEELHTLTKSRIKQGECIAVSANTLITLSGAGSKNAASAAQNLIILGANQLISWGCAGALSPQLKAGDLVVPADILTRDNIQLTTHKQWSRKVIDLLDKTIKHTQATLLESDTVIGQACDKNRLYLTTQAIAVDMESAAVAQLAQQAQLPFIAIRSIVDPAQLDLPGAIDYAMTDSGVISIRKLLRYLCSHPGDLPRLITLGMHFNAAKKTLKYLAGQLPQITRTQWSLA